jgi:hypothetical protein
VQFGGELLGSDILALCIVPIFLLNRGRRRALVQDRYLFLGLIIWFIGALITDLIRATPQEDFVRGWSKIAFFSLTIIAIRLISVDKFEPLRAAALGGVCAGLFSTVFFPNEFIGSNPFEQSSWKFGLGPSLTMFAAIIGSFPSIARLWGGVGTTAPLFVMAAANLMMNSRSSFGVAAAAALFCLFNRALEMRPQLKRKISPIAFAIIMGLGLGASQLLTGLYAVAASSGALGLDAQDKYEAQTSGSLGLLQSGRNESLVSFEAIADSPIIGHGSWARDVHYVAMLAEKLEAAGVQGFGDIYTSDLIPSHSHILGSWVEAGIAGGLFWSGILVVAFVALYRLLKMDNAYTSFTAYTIMILIWDVLFSPFGREQRFFSAAKICVALWIVRSNSRSPSQRNG